MAEELGDTYLRRLATFIRTNEKSLAEAGVTRRRRSQRPDPTSDIRSLLNPLAWLGLDTMISGNTSRTLKPVILCTNTHHLFYVLMRLEALDYDIGTLDVHIDSPSRPMSYVNIFSEPDRSETLSLSSFRSSLSVVSKLSLGAGWWSMVEPPSVDAELKYIYSSFTKLPALNINAPGKCVIAELVSNPPGQNALPLDAFKNLQALESVDIDPRTLLGWDRLAESLQSLTIRRSGLEDISDIFIGSVIDDQARREGSPSRKRKRRIPKHLAQRSELPDAVVEDETEESRPEATERPSISLPQLSSLKWAFLKYLSLADNSLTFISAEPLSFLTSLTHLDLSSNLLNSVPPALTTLYNLVSLNLSDNMIDSVLGIYLNLGHVLYLNISHNRLESLCGLERLHALERVDLRWNLLEESAEVGRLGPLPNISDIWIEGNPFVEYEERYRISCFNYFWEEGKAVTLDGTLPGFYEKHSLSMLPSEQMSSTRMQIIPSSPPVVAVSHVHQDHAPDASSAKEFVEGLPTPPSSNSSPHLSPLPAASVSGKARRKQPKRIVEFDRTTNETCLVSSGHRKMRSDDSQREKAKIKPRRDQSPLEATTDMESMTPRPHDSAGRLVQPMSPRHSRHSRYQTEYVQYSDAAAEYPEAAQPNAPPTPLSSIGNAEAMSRSGLRAARVSASLCEPGLRNEEELQDQGEDYRRRIEGLKKDMGDAWLKVFSQYELKSG